MKLKESYPLGVRTAREYDVEQAVVLTLTQGGYDGGAVECARRVADASGEMLAKVVSMLHASGKLSDDEVMSLLSGFTKVE